MLLVEWFLLLLFCLFLVLDVEFRNSLVVYKTQCFTLGALLTARHPVTTCPHQWLLKKIKIFSLEIKIEGNLQVAVILQGHIIFGLG